MRTGAAGATPLVLPDDVIEQLGDRYLALPAVWRARLSFEGFLLNRLQIRNGALFEKLRHHRTHRHGRTALRMRGDQR